jgi:hypothetical protein
MATKQFAEQKIDPADILDGARTLSRRHAVWTMDVIPEWLKADEYLTWAKTGLNLDSSFGFDAAVCYAKRAVCRLIDSVLIHNHLGDRAGTYPQKMELLATIGIVIPDVAHDLVIDPRNDIEHGYRSIVPRHARNAVQIAELVLTALRVESERQAIISLGLNYGPMIQSAVNDGEPWPWGYGANPKDTMLVVDMLSSKPKVMMIDHAYETARFAYLAEFKSDQAIDLVAQLREQLAENQLFLMGCIPLHFQDFRRRLGLTA